MVELREESEDAMEGAVIVGDDVAWVKWLKGSVRRIKAEGKTFVDQCYILDHGAIPPG